MNPLAWIVVLLGVLLIIAAYKGSYHNILSSIKAV